MSHDIFTRLQIKKLIYFAEQKLLQRGVMSDMLCFGSRKTPIIGISFKSQDNKEIKLPKNIKGVYVYDVYSKDYPGHAPAYFGGIKQGDIIMSVDGYEMNSPEKFIQYIRSLKPYDWVTVHIKRGKKEMDIEVELTWY